MVDEALLSPSPGFKLLKDKGCFLFVTGAVQCGTNKEVMPLPRECRLIPAGFEISRPSSDFQGSVGKMTQVDRASCFTYPKGRADNLYT